MENTTKTAMFGNGVGTLSIFTTEPLNMTEASVLSDLDLIMGKMYFWMTGLTSILSITGSLLILAIYIFLADIRSPGKFNMTVLI